MKKALLIVFLFAHVLAFSKLEDSYGEEIRNTSIRIVDAKTGEPIIGAAVQLTCMAEVQYTDPDGMIQIQVDSASECDISITYVSYLDTELDLSQLTDNQEIGLKSR
jgi:hypothetical protein